MPIVRSGTECRCSSRAGTERARLLTQVADDPATHLAVDVPDSPREAIRKDRNIPLATPQRAHLTYRRGVRFRLRPARPLRRRVFLSTLREGEFRPRPF